jgi:hypothetical protein
MNTLIRHGWLMWLFGAVILWIIGVGCFVWLTKGQSPEQAAAEIVEKCGGRVVSGRAEGFASSSHVIGVDLTGVTLDAPLMDTLHQFPGLTRLTLDRATLPPHVAKWLGALSQLESLSLAKSNVSDDDLTPLPSVLKSLSLSGTAVTDKCMSGLSTLRALTNLDLTDTAVSAKGLQSLQSLSTLKTLRVDEDCITAESVAALQGMQLSSVEVTTSAGLAHQTYDLLSLCKTLNSRGLRSDGLALWSTALPWDNTLAGVVEAVAAEVGLDPLQTDQLLECLSDPPVENWATIPTPQEGWRTWFTEETFIPDEGVNLATADDLIRELQKRPLGTNRDAVRQYVRERFSADDVPKLLSAVRAFAWSDAAKDPVARSSGLYRYGPFLLVRYGFENPQVLAELERQLTDEDSRMFQPTVYAFGYGGARPFYAYDEWVANEAADNWVVPRLLSICRNKHKAAWLRDNARTMLTEIALRRPEHVAEILSALVDLLREDGPWIAQANDPLEISRNDISRLAATNPNAAIALVPQIRQILHELDQQVAREPAVAITTDSPPNSLRIRQYSVLAALSAAAHYSPELACDIALEYVQRLEQGQPIGPFSTLLSPDTSEVNRTVVLALLKNPGSADANIRNQANSGDISPLAALAKAIRDWRAKTL